MPEGRINKEHDLGYKHLLTHKKTFIQLLRSFVKEDWVKEIDESQVMLINKSYVLQDFKEKESDIVYRLKIKDRNVIFYCLLELQSSVDYQMPLRLLFYMIEIWRDILKNTEHHEAERKGFKLPCIVPIVLYNGVNNWTVCRSFREMLDGSEIFSNHVLDFNYILFDVNRYEEEELLGLANLISGVFLLDQKIDSEQLKDRLVKMIEILGDLSEEEFGLFKGWLKWILKPRISEELRFKIDDILEKSRPTEVENMVYNLANTIDEMTQKAMEKGIEEGIQKGIQKGIEEGIQKGIEEGLQKGIKEGVLKVAKSALEKGAGIDFVASITELDIEIVKKLKEEIERTK
ncbi:Rpn family recombination-promoting nuclease/putative transposase [Acetivibrio saccincola]|uniref:Flagellar assembly protein H n=1 Tax=Acetivibrio saccincola TaxID=1677857 RepID=A0A2K9E0J6_9FIRM|nr:Rpn family recombination-promoting nuclease/putative transposase [Acetivibrio saccincola]AUG57302.1 flagellar assembly protein H [Acetivibrio saccincola]